MAGKTDVAHLAVFLGFCQRFGCSIGTNKKVGIVIESHAVDLPQVEVIGLKAAKRFFEHEKSQTRIAPVRARFCHEEDLLAKALQTCAHPDFRFPAPILPAVIEKGDAAIDSLVNDLNGGLGIWSLSQVVAAEAES